MRNHVRPCHAVVLFTLASAAIGCGRPGNEDPSPIPQSQATVDLDEGDMIAHAIMLAEVEEPSGIPDASSAAMPASGHASALFAQARRYDRDRALSYIRRYAETPNPNFRYCGNWTLDGKNGAVKIQADCTNFASQVLWYGGLPVVWSNDESGGWWYGYGCSSTGSSTTWRSVMQLHWFLTIGSGYAEIVRDRRQLKVGDLIFYKLKSKETGYRCDLPGELNHTTVVSGFKDGEPVVSYHSNDRANIPWNSRGSTPGGLGDACITSFVHIKD